MTGQPCALCPVYLRPAKDRRTAEVGRACHGCLELLAEEVTDLGRRALYLPELVAPRNGGTRYGTTAGGHAGPRLPVSLDALSLTGPGGPAAGAGGGLPPLVLLREWATTWAVLRGLGAYGPPEYGTDPTGHTYVPGQRAPGYLAAWLVQRIPWAAHHLARLPEFARDVSVCLAAVRQVTAEVDPTGLGRPIGWCPAEGDAEGVQCLGPLRASTWEDVIRCPSCGAEYHRTNGGWADLARLLRTTRTGLNRRKDHAS